MLISGLARSNRDSSHVCNSSVTNYSISSEIELTEKSLNQQKSYFVNYLKTVLIILRKHDQIDYQHKKIKTVPKIVELNLTGKLFDNPKDKAEEVNDFSVNIGPNTEMEIPNITISSSNRETNYLTS